MIKPTIGRQVWYWHLGPIPRTQPEAATVAYVHSDTLVNLQVISHQGFARSETSVQLCQGDGDLPSSKCCEWMPYQKGQAVKTEEALRENSREGDGLVTITS